MRWTARALVLLGAVSWLAWSVAAAQNAPSEGELNGRERTYMSQLALVVDGARRLASYCELHGQERELTRFARPLAERYVELANRMLPSVKLAVAHPHVLLVVENLERSLDAAAAGDVAGRQKRLRVARDELANLEAVLKQLKLRVPELPR